MCVIVVQMLPVIITELSNPRYSSVPSSQVCMTIHALMQLKKNQQYFYLLQ